MEDLLLQIEEPGDGLFMKLVRQQIDYNQRFVVWGYQVFTLGLRDGRGRLRAGARGMVNLEMLDVRGVWVDEALRQQGLGTRVLAAVEQEGRARGAQRAVLDTYSFQALGFYEKLGYTRFGTLPYPNGIQRYYLHKDL